MEQEQWMVFRDYTNYLVSSTGRIKNLKTKRELKKFPNEAGYPIVYLYKEGKQFQIAIHRVLAELFIPNLNNLPIVDHIDHDRSNYAIENLHWVSYAENISNKVNRTCNRKPIKAINLVTKEQFEFSSAAEAIQFFKPSIPNINASNISKAIGGRLNSAYGYTWHYK